MSPVIITLRYESRGRFSIYVNGDRIWMGSEQVIAQHTVEQVIKRLEDEGFEVVPNL